VVLVHTARALLALILGLAGVASLEAMTTSTSESIHAARHRASGPDRGGLVNGKRALTGLATVLALWLGLTAPAVSPVAPTLASQPTPAVAAQQAIVTGTARAGAGAVPPGHGDTGPRGDGR
jgi:hypothetical protein